MTAAAQLAEAFERERPRLRAIAYRMLGSHAEADDAVQDTWLNLARTDTTAIGNLPGWLTTAVGRVCLNALRSRRRRGEVALETSVPDPEVRLADQAGPAQRAELEESVSLAMLVVMDRLGPDERVAFVLHDLFDVPFDPIAGLLEKSPAATRQLASRARHRVREASPGQVRGSSSAPDGAASGGRAAVAAFFAAAQAGDFDALVRVLHPEVLLRCDGGREPGGLTLLLRGHRDIAAQATTYGRLAPHAVPAVVNGAPGVVVLVGGAVRSVMAFSVSGSQIIEINVLADPRRLGSIPIPGA